GNFNNVGAFNLATGFYTDQSNATSVVAYTPGDIVLGSGVAGSNATADTNPAGGFATLNIAGSYNDSALSVQKAGTITGQVFVAGSGGKNWNLTSDTGIINVGFVAGFDVDGKGGITASEAGSLGNINATSLSNADVTIGVGGLAAASVVGNATATTGDVVTA